jgi:hypothetical protein
MRIIQICLTVFFLISCGGGGGSSTTTAPAPPPPTDDPVDPTPSVFFFDASSSLPESREQSCFDAQAVDIDSDGDLDLLMAGFSSGGSPNRLFSNDGTGNFTDDSATNIPAVGGISEHLTVGDMNGDGDPDVVFANVGSSGNPSHEYLLNTGSLGILETSSQGLPVTGLSSFVAARDFDGDNDLDLFIANFGTSHLLQNDGSGNFTDVSVTQLPGSDPDITEDSGIGDVDGNGTLDILLAYRGSSFEGQGLQNQLWLNDGAGSFSNNTGDLPDMSNSTFDIHLVDIDGDSDLDALIGNATIDQSNTPLLDNIWINNGTGQFTDETNTRWPQPVLSNTYGVNAVDLDRDGDLDILTAENTGPLGPGVVRAYANDGNGIFSEQTEQLLGSVLGNIVDIEVADLNGDGLADLYFCAATNFGTADTARDFLFIAQ